MDNNINNAAAALVAALQGSGVDRAAVQEIASEVAKEKIGALLPIVQKAISDGTAAAVAAAQAAGGVRRVEVAAATAENKEGRKMENCKNRVNLAALVSGWPQVGRITETRGAFDWLSRDGRRVGFARRCWRRYISGDWGELDDGDWASNDGALLEGGRVLASYRFQGRKVWIITEAAGDDGRRAYTTIMFPSEY